VGTQGQVTVILICSTLIAASSGFFVYRHIDVVDGAAHLRSLPGQTLDLERPGTLSFRNELL
jgi:hypothetical protein